MSTKLAGNFKKNFSLLRFQVLTTGIRKGKIGYDPQKEKEKTASKGG
jgi:hypothetical protein